MPFVMRLVNISDTLALSVETRGFTLAAVCTLSIKRNIPRFPMYCLFSALLRARCWWSYYERDRIKTSQFFLRRKDKDTRKPRLYRGIWRGDAPFRAFRRREEHFNVYRFGHHPKRQLRRTFGRSQDRGRGHQGQKSSAMCAARWAWYYRTPTSKLYRR